MQRKGARIWLILTSIVFGVTGVVLSLPLLFFSIFLFDAPGSQENPPTLLLYWSMVSFPVLCLFSIVGSWVLYRFTKDIMARFVSLLPLVSVLLFLVGWLWLDVSCGGNFGCPQADSVNIVECAFDGGDGLPTTLCEAARKIDNLNEPGYYQETTSSTSEAHNWQFSAQLGKQITIRMSTWGRGCPAIRMRILDSQGIVLESFDHPAPITCTSNTHTESTYFFDPPVDSTYTLRLDTPKTPGPYWFQIIEVKQ